MPSFNIVSNIPPRRVSLPEFDYGMLFVIIYILIVLILISYSKVNPKKGKLWSYTTIILFLSLFAFVFTNIWIQAQPSLGLTPAKETMHNNISTPSTKTFISPYYSQAPLITVTDNAKKGSIGGVIVQSGQPVPNKEIVLHGTTTDGDIKFARIIATTFTDKEGKYSFKDLQPGKYNVEIVEKRDAGSYETSAPFYNNQHEVIIGVDGHITDYNYDY